jgi:hypothetical protein
MYLFGGFGESCTDGVFVMVQFVFLDSMYIRFLFALVATYLYDLVFDGGDCYVVMVLRCQSGCIRWLGYLHCVAAIFINGW